MKCLQDDLTRPWCMSCKPLRTLKFLLPVRSHPVHNNDSFGSLKAMQLQCLT